MAPCGERHKESSCSLFSRRDEHEITVMWWCCKPRVSISYMSQQHRSFSIRSFFFSWHPIHKAITDRSRTAHPVNKPLHRWGVIWHWSQCLLAVTLGRRLHQQSSLIGAFTQIPSLWVGIFQGHAAVFICFDYNISHFKAALETFLFFNIKHNEVRMQHRGESDLSLKWNWVYVLSAADCSVMTWQKLTAYKSDALSEWGYCCSLCQYKTEESGKMSWTDDPDANISEENISLNTVPQKNLMNKS